jgi:hypothetical protein
MKDSLQILDFKNSLQQVEMEEAEQLDNLALAKWKIWASLQNLTSAAQIAKKEAISYKK